jgi:hypothetical protein
MTGNNLQRQFVLFAFALLIPAFVLWTPLSGPLALPAIGLGNLVLTTWLPDIVQVVLAEGPKALVMTQFGELGGQILPASEESGQLGFYVDTRILSYSLPFYTALHFATPRTNYLGVYCWGIPVLYVFIVFGIVCVSLKELMVTLGTGTLEQAQNPVPGADAIAILYQLNTLIIPAVTPILLWGWQSRETAMMQDLLTSLAPQKP